MSLRTSFQKLIRRDPTASLHERAAVLRAGIRGRQTSRNDEDTSVGPSQPMLMPGSEEAKAAFKAACHDHSVRTQFANGYPDLKRSPLEWWTAQSLSKALESGELSPAECARLYPLATERELRMAAIEHELNLGGLFALAYADEYPVVAADSVGDVGEEDAGADAELIRLGSQFEAARAREKAACEACNAAQDEATRHMPERPAALLFRASDHPLRLRKYLTHPDTLEGEEVTADDIAWMTRKPYVREVRRPVRPEDNLPPDARTVIDTSPWPEAQERADEIVTAWEAWHAERLRIYGEHVTDALDKAANDAGDVAATLACRIAVLPALTAVGFRVKLQALCSYDRKALLSEVPEEPDPDQLLSHSLWRDVQGDVVANDDHPATVEEAATLDFAAYAFDLPTRDPNGWMKEFAQHAIGMHVADRTLRMSKLELVAFIQKGGERDAEVPVTMLAALESAQRTFEGWGKLLDLARTRYMVAGSSAVLAQDGRVTAETAEPEDWREAPQASEPSAEPSATFSLVSMIDFASASLDELQALHDIADLVGSVAYATVWSARCKARGRGDEPNAAGKLMQWLGDALTEVETAANNKARRREPANSSDRETRLKMLALPVIQNGDPDETEAFARDLLAHAAAERRGR